MGSEESERKEREWPRVLIWCWAFMHLSVFCLFGRGGLS